MTEVPDKALASIVLWLRSKFHKLNLCRDLQSSHDWQKCYTNLAVKSCCQDHQQRLGSKCNNFPSSQIRTCCLILASSQVLAKGLLSYDSY